VVKMLEFNEFSEDIDIEEQDNTLSSYNEECSNEDCSSEDHDDLKRLSEKKNSFSAIPSKSVGEVLNLIFDMGDHIEVYYGDEQIDSLGSFIIATDDMLIWVGSKGYVNFQHLAGPISIRKVGSSNKKHKQEDRKEKKSHQNSKEEGSKKSKRDAKSKGDENVLNFTKLEAEITEETEEFHQTGTVNIGAQLNEEDEIVSKISKSNENSFGDIEEESTQHVLEENKVTTIQNDVVDDLFSTNTNYALLDENEEEIEKEPMLEAIRSSIDIEEGELFEKSEWNESKDMDQVKK
jgi:hypothetical protein